MQNHGSFDYAGDNFEKSVSLVGHDAEYPDVEQYLSLIHETDKALEYLISYFEEEDEDVVILFFGDHQPRVDEKFYAEISGGEAETLDERQNRFKVPFFVWANYDIEEEFVECTSLNYLSAYLYRLAGIELPPYNQFLDEMEEKIPAINANGFYSMESDCFMLFDMASEEEQKWLESYEILQYNNVFDEKRDHLQSNALFALYVGCDHGAHKLCIHFCAHTMLYFPADFVKGVFSNLWIYFGSRIEGEVSERPAWKQGPQIYRK